MKNLSIQGSKGIHKMNLAAFTGDKAMDKSSFEKKYKGRLDTVSAWNKIQEALKDKKAEDAKNKSEAEATAKKEATTKEAKKALKAKKKKEVKKK